MWQLFKTLFRKLKISRDNPCTRIYIGACACGYTHKHCSPGWPQTCSSPASVWDSCHVSPHPASHYSWKVLCLSFSIMLAGQSCLPLLFCKILNQRNQNLPVCAIQSEGEPPGPAFCSSEALLFMLPRAAVLGSAHVQSLHSCARVSGFWEGTAWVRDGAMWVCLLSHSQTINTTPSIPSKLTAQYAESSFYESLPS